MAASFIRRKAAIMCHYPWAMIFLPLPRVVFFFFFPFFFLSSNTWIFIAKKKATASNKTTGEMAFPCTGTK